MLDGKLKDTPAIKYTEQNNCTTTEIISLLPMSLTYILPMNWLGRRNQQRHMDSLTIQTLKLIHSKQLPRPDSM
jgi:hypothetical protein